MTTSSGGARDADRAVGPRGDGAGPDPVPVLLCAGMAEGAASWDALVPLLAGRHRIARLDRPGLGVVPDDGRVPTLAGEAARIGALVEELGRPVLVAHSAAALPAEAYARRHPERLAGLVLVDPSLVDPAPAGADAPAPGPTLAGVRRAHAERAAARLARLLVAVAPTLGAAADRAGLAGRLGPWVWRRAVRRMSVRPPQPERAAPYRSGSVLLRVLVELLAYPGMAADLVALRAATGPPPLPVVVLTALGDLPTARGRAAWRAGHARLAASFPNGRQEVLRDARHLLPGDRPEVVAAAVAALGRDTGS
ncbi:alpha/beta fold hydrolase [Micromonospora sp. NPDC000089]|uniref:alpha/beta fold hydrolase n=1 Tax=unclassified Micromonospora TaxID=2617518 RepID=UPI0036A56144